MLEPVHVHQDLSCAIYLAKVACIEFLNAFDAHGCRGFDVAQLQPLVKIQSAQVVKIQSAQTAYCNWRGENLVFQVLTPEF